MFSFLVLSSHNCHNFILPPFPLSSLSQKAREVSGMMSAAEAAKQLQDFVHNQEAGTHARIQRYRKRVIAAASTRYILTWSFTLARAAAQSTFAYVQGSELQKLRWEGC